MNLLPISLFAQNLHFTAPTEQAKHERMLTGTSRIWHKKQDSPEIKAAKTIHTTFDELTPNVIKKTFAISTSLSPSQ
jgi:hypothetical protein